MEILKSALDTFFSFKAYVMLPFIMLALALIVRLNLRDALFAALKLGVGFASIFVVFSFFVDNIKPAVEAIVNIRGLDYPVLDVGWPPLAAITWSSFIAPLSIILVLFLNIILIASNLTKTIYIDIWNYWHFAFLGALVSAVTHNIWLAIAATLLIATITIKLSDWAAVYIKRETGLESITISPVSVVGILPLSAALDFLYDKIPGIKNLSANPEKAQKKGNLLAEPMVVGLLLGIVLGILAAYPVKKLLELSVNIAAVMYLLPLAGELIAKGIQPISHNLKELIQKRFPAKKELYVAVDTGILMQHRSVIVSGLILMPISILIAFFLPGNKVIPIGDLPNLISVMSISALLYRGNVIRTVLTGIPVVTSYLLISSKLAPLFTTLSKGSGVDLPKDHQITAFTDGGHQLRYYLLELFSGKTWAIIAIPAVLLLFFAIYKHSTRTQKEENK
ncbi:PTS transporter subunit IIC [Spirochaetia bacterium 38H-sp]|uniref:PTS transporter subunit IIC n=1 Tax=Rarispira pelagica TaxID=3141764 RepID=A0ABU9UD70_9SPIR